MSDQLTLVPDGNSAVISECGRYRYELRRVWDPAGPLLEFVMLNPSTADAEKDDPTIRRCIGPDWPGQPRLPGQHDRHLNHRGVGCPPRGRGVVERLPLRHHRGAETTAAVLPGRQRKRVTETPAVRAGRPHTDPMGTVMSNKARIAEILREHRKSWYVQSGVATCTASRCGWSKFGTITQTDAAHAKHLAELIGVALHPRIDAVEQLDALPDDAVVYDAQGNVWQRHGKSYLGDRSWWAAGSEVEELPSAITLPVRVLYTPEVDR